MKAFSHEQLLSDLLARGGIKEVRWVVETRHPGQGATASVGGDYPRLLLGLSGRRHLRAMLDGRAQDVVLSPGTCLVVAPHCWLVTDFRDSFLSLGVALEARNPRLLITRHIGRRRGATRAFEPSQVALMPGLCDDTVMGLASALLSARPESKDDLYARRLAEAVWLRLVRFRSQRDAAPGKAHLTYHAAEHFVRENFGRQISRNEVARHLRVHASHVTRLFLRFSGESFGGYLLRVRLESARLLLRDFRLTVSEAAYLAGFTSPSYFGRAYRKRYRITPGRDRTAAT